jgi:hypothetical protein
MKLFIIVRDDVTIANGAVFAPGATVVHSLLRRDRDSLTRFANLAEVKQAYRGCKVEIVESSRDATYGYVVRRARRSPATKKRKKPSA